MGEVLSWDLLREVWKEGGENVELGLDALRCYKEGTGLTLSIVDTPVDEVSNAGRNEDEK